MRCCALACFTTSHCLHESVRVVGRSPTFESFSYSHEDRFAHILWYWHAFCRKLKPVRFSWVSDSPQVLIETGYSTALRMIRLGETRHSLSFSCQTSLRPSNQLNTMQTEQKSQRTLSLATPTNQPEKSRSSYEHLRAYVLSYLCEWSYVA